MTEQEVYISYLTKRSASSMNASEIIIQDFVSRLKHVDIHNVDIYGSSEYKKNNIEIANTVTAFFASLLTLTCALLNCIQLQVPCKESASTTAFFLYLCCRDLYMDAIEPGKASHLTEHRTAKG